MCIRDSIEKFCNSSMIYSVEYLYIKKTFLLLPAFIAATTALHTHCPDASVVSSIEIHIFVLQCIPNITNYAFKTLWHIVSVECRFVNYYVV